MNQDHHLSRDHSKGPWSVKLTIPAPLRPLFDGKIRFAQSTGTTDIKAARLIRDEVLPKWRQAIQQAREGAPVAHLLEDLEGEAKDRALEALRETAIDIAIDTGNRAPLDAIDRFSRTSQSLSRFLEGWIAYLEQHYSPATINAYKGHIPHLFEQFPTEDDIKNRHQVANRIAQYKLSANTQRQRLAAWKRYIVFYERASENSRDLSSLFTGIQIKTPRNHQNREPFTPQEVSRLVSAATEPLRSLIILGYFTGARIEELSRLTPADRSIHSGLDVLAIHGTKTENADRMIPLDPRASHAASVWLSALSQRKPSKRTYDDRRSAPYGQQFSRLKTSLGFPKQKTFHSLRHTVVNILSRELVHPAVLDAILGHAPEDFTRRTYSGAVDLEHLDKALRLLPDI